MPRLRELRLCTPLHLAARSGRRSTIELLLERRARVTERDGRGHTALRHAASALKPQAVNVLLVNGAEATYFSAALHAGLRKLEATARRVLESSGGGSSSSRRKLSAAAEDAAADAAADEMGALLESEDELEDASGESEREAEAEGTVRLTASIQEKAAQWARVLACLARGGAAVKRSDLDDLGVGWSECEHHLSGRGPAAEERPSAAVGGSRRRSPPSLFYTSMRAAAQTLTAENVLERFYAARMVGARPLQSECERLLLQNAQRLEEAGTFAAVGVSAGRALRALLSNVLRRRVAAVVQREWPEEGTRLIDQRRLVRRLAWAEELDIFAAPEGEAMEESDADGESEGAEDEEED